MSVVTAKIAAGSTPDVPEPQVAEISSLACSQDLAQSKAIAAAMRALQDRAQSLQTLHARLLQDFECMQFEELRLKDEHLAANLSTRSETQSRESAQQRTAEALSKELQDLIAAELRTDQQLKQLQADLASLQQAKSDQIAARVKQEKQLTAQLETLKQQDSDASSRLGRLAEESRVGLEETESLKDRNFQLSQMVASRSSDLAAITQAFEKLTRTVEAETDNYELEVERRVEQISLSEEKLRTENSFLQEQEHFLDRELEEARYQIELLKRRPEPEYEAREGKASLRIPEHPMGITSVSCRQKTKKEEIATISELEKDIGVLGRKCKKTLEQVSTPAAAENNAQEIASMTSLIEEKTKHLMKLKRSRQAAIRNQVISSL